MPESATSARPTVSVRMVQAATLLTISGLTVTDLLGPQAFAQIRDKMEKALAGRRVSYERTQVMPNGAVYHLSVLYLPHFGPDGKAVGFFFGDQRHHRTQAPGRPACSCGLRKAGRQGRPARHQRRQRP